MINHRYVLRRAQSSELDTVMALLRERVEWLREQGSDQWSTWTTWQATKIQPALDEGHVWLLFDEGRPIGTITVEFRGDADFWTPEECSQPAAYLSKLAIRLDHAGKELGSLLIDWARDYAYRHGCKAVRLDAWKTNVKLQAYYAERGWKHLRTVEVPGRNSGSLFELHVQTLAPAQRERLHEDIDVMILDETPRASMETDPSGGSGNWRPSHVHRGGMVIQHDALQRPGGGFFIDFMRYRLRHSDGQWQLESVNGHFTDWHREGTVLDAKAQLSTEMAYVITHQFIDDTCRMIITPVPPELGTCATPAKPG